MQLRRKRTACQAAIEDDNVQELKTTRRKLHKLLKKDCATLSVEEKTILEENKKLVSAIAKNRDRNSLKKSRLSEFEDDVTTVTQQCEQLAEALAKSSHAVVYTGAGISTSADIPDYRGKNGIWNKLHEGEKILMKKSLTAAQPTIAHMCLRALHQKGLVKHIVSQNCDGLHLRSGIPQHGLSEVHGNMFMEICSSCDEQIYRVFDVTTKTSLHHHKTDRTCHCCGNSLRDTIVHFGERSCLKSPHNWEGAISNAEKADMIICLGSSLKVLRSYKNLWMTKRPKRKRPALYIVNLQWTPKDSQALMKIHSRVDFVMETVAKLLDVTVPAYSEQDDPLYSLATPCDHINETMTIPQKFSEKFRAMDCRSQDICPSMNYCKDESRDFKSTVKTELSTKSSCDSPLSSICDVATSKNVKSDAAVPAWFGKGVKSKQLGSRRKRKRVA